MRYLRLCFIVISASGWMLAADPPNGGKPGSSSGEADRVAADHMAGSASRPIVPRVLRDTEPADSTVVRLPGPAPVIPPSPPPAPPQVIAKAVEPAARLQPPPSVSLEDPGRPFLRRAPRPVYPAEFERDSAMYCQKLINQWTLEDAAMLLGEAHGSRHAFDDQEKENGTIYAFSDPTGHYRQIELDFDAETGSLRTVFGYPWNLTWQECRRLWGANVSAAEANKGRKFYSYLNRRLDVLVDRGGKVISLGLY
jgi:hypothetical protein